MLSVLMIYYLVTFNVRLKFLDVERNTKECDYINIIGNRCFNVFKKEKFQEINDYFDRYEKVWDKNEYGRFEIIHNLMETPITFQFGSPRVIPAGTFVVFPENIGIHWSNGFYLKCSITSKIFYPEPNSCLKWEHDLIVISNDISRIRMIIDF